MASPQFKLIIPVPTDFVAKLKEEMEDEFEQASRKWQAYPSDEEKRQIFINSVEQLKTRANSVITSNWNLESDRLVVSTAGPKGELEWGSADAKKCDLKFIRARDGWVIDQDRSADALSLDELPSALFEELLQWARTAVFYGVGSYRP